MTDAVVHPTALASDAVLRCMRFAALIRRSLCRAAVAHETRRALDELPDNLLKDLGLARSDIPFVAGALASAELGPARDALDRLNRRAAERDTATRLSQVALRVMLLAAAAVSAFAVPARDGLARDAQVERGQDLVTCKPDKTAHRAAPRSACSAIWPPLLATGGAKNYVC